MIYPAQNEFIYMVPSGENSSMKQRIGEKPAMGHYSASDPAT